MRGSGFSLCVYLVDDEGKKKSHPIAEKRISFKGIPAGYYIAVPFGHNYLVQVQNGSSSHTAVECKSIFNY